MSATLWFFLSEPVITFPFKAFMKRHREAAQCSILFLNEAKLHMLKPSRTANVLFFFFPHAESNLLIKQPNGGNSTHSWPQLLR